MPVRIQIRQQNEFRDIYINMIPEMSYLAQLQQKSVFLECHFSYPWPRGQKKIIINTRMKTTSLILSAGSVNN